MFTIIVGSRILRGSNDQTDTKQEDVEATYAAMFDERLYGEHYGEVFVLRLKAFLGELIYLSFFLDAWSTYLQSSDINQTLPIAFRGPTILLHICAVG
jgi:hypothetical protein